jgi:ribosomal subunit interface protein
MPDTEISVQIQIAGKNLSLGDALKERIASELDSVVTKYFDRPADGHVTVTKDGHQVEVDCNIHLPSGIILQSQGKAADAHAALDDAVAKLDKRVRRYKRRLRDHHKPNRAPLPSEMAASFVIRPSDDSEIEDDDDANTSNGHDEPPLIVAETHTEVKTMSVSTAVMQLELSEKPAILFRNASTRSLNMVYLRPDGHIGWVDPGTGEADD